MNVEYVQDKIPPPPMPETNLHRVILGQCRGGQQPANKQYTSDMCIFL